MNVNLKPSPGIRVRKARAGRVPLLILTPEHPRENAPGVLWIHGGGYILGMKEMVYMSRAADLCRECGAMYNIMANEGKCPKCGSRYKKILGGQQFLLKEIGYE